MLEKNNFKIFYRHHILNLPVVQISKAVFINNGRKTLINFQGQKRKIESGLGLIVFEI